MYDETGVDIQPARKRPAIPTGAWDGVAMNNYAEFPSEDFFMSDS